MTKFTLDAPKAEYEDIADMDCGTIFKANGSYYILTDELDRNGKVLAISLDESLGTIEHFDTDETFEVVESELILKIRG